MPITVLSYNTLFAGRDGAETKRADSQVELINDLQPDIFLMQEARGFEADGYAAFHAFERRVGMRGFLAQALHTGQNTAIFIREPLRAKSFDSDSVHFYHALARLIVTLPNERDLAVMSAHLCPNGPQVRRGEVAYLAPMAQPETLALVAGDFNSVYPHDAEPSDYKDLPVHHRARYLGDDMESIDRSVMAMLDAGGWIDIGHRLGKSAISTVPTPAYRDAEFPTMRCDYILTTPTLAEAAQSYEVVKSPLTDAASDHYPILATFEI